MRLYLELAKKSFQRQIAYRTATLAGLVTNVFFGVLRGAVMVALYGATQSIAGYTLRDAVTYTGLVQALIGAIALWGWYDMIRSIKTGEVAGDLSRPFDYYSFWLAQDLGRGIFQVITRSVITMSVFVIFFGASTPVSIEQWAFTIVTLGLALLLSFGWRFLVSALGFWVVDATGYARLAFFVVLFPSGFAVPLAFMPSWLQALCNLTPFPSIINTPVEIYLGHVRGVEALALIGVQAVWTIGLIALGRLAAEAGRRKLTIQGG